MIRTKLGWAAMAAMVVCAGCDETSMSADGGARDARVGDTDAALIDSGPMRSDAGRDAQMGDAGAACGPVVCPESDVCIREVCVAHCGADLSALALALADGLTPVQNFCVPPAGLVFGAHAPSAGMPIVYAVGAASEGRTTTFTLSRWALDPSAPTPTSTVVATATYTAPMDAVLVFLGGSVSVSPDGSTAIFGYTTTEDGSVGGVFDVTTGGGSVVEVSGPGNFGASWLGADHFAVNGLGLASVSAGQGLYVYDRAMMTAQHAATAMGAFSGSVALIEGGFLLAGGSQPFGVPWVDGAEGDRLFLFGRDAVLGATTAAPIAAEDNAEVPFASAPSAFAWLPGRGIATKRYDDTFAVEAIELRTVTVEAGVLSVGAPSDLAAAPVSEVTAVGDSRVLLQHADGLLLVE